MTRKYSRITVFAASLSFALVAIGPPVHAGTIDFEGLSDSTTIGGTYSGLGVVFSNAVALSAGISLDEAEFPPRSGISVATDLTGAITLTFSTPVTSFLGYFTYASALSLVGTLSGSTVSTANSAFSSNFVSSGHAPNELLQLTSAGGIGQITITGDPHGGSFVVDDITFSTVTNAGTPEPATWALIGAGLLSVAIRRSRVSRPVSNRTNGTNRK